MARSERMTAKPGRKTERVILPEQLLREASREIGSLARFLEESYSQCYEGGDDFLKELKRLRGLGDEGVFAGLREEGEKGLLGLRKRRSLAIPGAGDGPGVEVGKFSFSELLKQNRGRLRETDMEAVLQAEMQCAMGAPIEDFIKFSKDLEKFFSNLFGR